MHKITDEEVEFILNDITKKGIVTEDVKYNILDHVCCIIENELEIGMDFNEFYRNTIARFYCKELQEIEEETQLLITFKYYHAMKRTVKITGLVAIFMILVGSLFKVQHWPGAGITLVLGFAIFSFLFIPLNIIMKFRDDKEKYNRIVMTLGLTLVLTGTIGLLFKVMHWPFANYLFFGSLAIFGLVFIPIYFFTNYRRPETKFNAIIHTTFMIAAAGMLFTLINLKSSENMSDAKDKETAFQLANINDYNELNATLYKEVESGSTESVQLFKKHSVDLINCINGIETNLISKSNQISKQKAATLTINDLKYKNDYDVVEQHFSKSKDEFSHFQFTLVIESYNNMIEQLDEANLVRKIDESKLKFDEIHIEMLLSNLNEIKIQALANENAYLSYQKGLLANN